MASNTEDENNLRVLSALQVTFLKNHTIIKNITFFEEKSRAWICDTQAIAKQTNSSTTGDKVHNKNRWKIDDKMPSHVEFLFWSIFNRFLLPTWTPRTQKIKPPLQGEHDFLKNRFSQVASIFDRFGCQHGSIFLPKILQNPPENRSQDASNFWSILASIFSRFLFNLGGQLGAMLATFSSKMGGPN